MNTAHTPTPWKQSGDCIYSSEGKLGANICAVGSPRASGLVGYSKLGFSDPDQKEAYANAAFIVRACNSHAALVAALENAVRCIAYLAPQVKSLPSEKRETEATVDEARAALNAAKS